jgi:hypothetical protein
VHVGLPGESDAALRLQAAAGPGGAAIGSDLGQRKQARRAGVATVERVSVSTDRGQRGAVNEIVPLGENRDPRPATLWVPASIRQDGWSSGTGCFG